MCGIQGFFSASNIENYKDSGFLENFYKSLSQIDHRGPDGFGFWARGEQRPYVSDKKSITFSELYSIFNTTNTNIIFAHRRLSIIDLSLAGAQPMSLQTKGGKTNDLTIIFNGEIYNYLELREELKSLNHHFHTDSDTEVILKAFEEWGNNCFNKFNGMWAIALWDERKQTLTLSRDRFGVKPLYFCNALNGVFFGSEIKQCLEFLKLNKINISFNKPLVNDWQNKDLLHHSLETIYSGIYSLKPAHFIEINKLKNNSLNEINSSLQSFWNFPIKEHHYSFKDSAKQVASLLESSIKLRLRSDVAVGSALSGGIDSSAVVSIIAKSNPLKQKTFSAIFPNDPIDEKKYIDMVLKNKNLEPHFIIPTANNFEDEFNKINFHHDGMLNTSSTYIQWNVYRITDQENVRVMLDGQGADEIFAGYEGFLKAHLKEVIKKQGFVKAFLEAGLFINNHRSYFANKFSKKIKSSSNSDEPSNSKYFYGDENQYQDQPLKRALYLATTRTSLPALLMNADRNSMAFSVESRTPFLDYRLVEFAFQCPSNFHIQNGNRKSLLREAVKNLIPEAIRIRKDKIGFAAPKTFWNKPISVKLNALNNSTWILK